MTNSDSDWTLEFNIADVPEPINISFDDELLLGRIPLTEAPTSLDLTPYNAERLGVSRRHAMIRKVGNKFTLTDLDSESGTLVNGERLAPNHAHPLNDRDQVTLGQLRMTLQLNIEIGDSAILAQRVPLDLRSAPRLGHGQRVLLVEDEASIAKLYQLLLDKDGFVTRICYDVVCAIQELNRTTWSLVILDLMFQSIHGMELCRYIRQDADNPTLPIIVLSARSEPNLIQQVMDSGADVYMVKPPNNRELSRVVSALIGRNERDTPVLKTKPILRPAVHDTLTAATDKDTVVLFIEGHREPVSFVVTTQVTLGHQQINDGPFLHIALDSYGALVKGVSRLHAALKRRGREIYLEDLESTNGTFVNGYSLPAHQDVPVANADEIRLGGLRMHIYMLAAEDQ